MLVECVHDRLHAVLKLHRLVLDGHALALIAGVVEMPGAIEILFVLHRFAQREPEMDLFDICQVISFDLLQHVVNFLVFELEDLEVGHAPVSRAETWPRLNRLPICFQRAILITNRFQFPCVRRQDGRDRIVDCQGSFERLYRFLRIHRAPIGVAQAGPRLRAVRLQRRRLLVGGNCLCELVHVHHQRAKRQPGAEVVRRQLSGSPQQCFSVFEIFLAMPVANGKLLQGIDAVRVYPQNVTENANGFLVLIRPPQFDPLEYGGAFRVLVDILTKRFIGFVPAACSDQRLPQFSLCQWQGRLQFKSPLELGYGVLEPGLHRQRATEILVQLRKLRFDAQCKSKLLFGFAGTVLFHQRLAQETKMIGATRVLEQVITAHFFRPQWTVSAKIAKRRLNAGVFGRW